MRLTRILNILSTVFAGLLVLFSLMFAYLLIIPVDVLKDWHIRTDQNSYKAGDRANASIEYDKTRNARGTAFYYVECKRNGSGWRRYLVSQVKSSVSAGKGFRTIPISIPEEVGNLPATCRFTISVTYDVFKFRNVTEETHSNEFKVIE